MDKAAVEALLAALRFEPQVITGLNAQSVYAIVPPGAEVKNLAPYLGKPSWIDQQVTALSVESFCAYVKKWGTECTVIFANENNMVYRAILDYHPPVDDGMIEERAECAHQVTYLCPFSDEWNHWVNNSGRMLGQQEFAEFLEENLKDIIEPVGADMLQLALNLQIHKAAQFESGMRLDNGQVQFRYTETIKGSSKVGDLAIPAAFKIRIPVFTDGASYPLEARFRYVLKDGALTMGYKLLRLHEVKRAAIKVVTAEITTGQPFQVIKGYL